jgi:ZIP family zinc transporter
LNTHIIAIFAGLILPFIGTTLGSGVVLLFKNQINEKINKIFLGFSGGVMLAASCWSLIIPSIEMATEQNIIAWIPACVGILLGSIFIPICDKFIKQENSMLYFAITLHNIPEGMAVGVALASTLYGNFESLIASALVFSIGIAVQNFPEGAAISLPLRSSGKSRLKSFWYGTLSGIVEPIAGVITIIFAFILEPILPYLLAFAAGAMIFVVIEELVPEIVGERMGTYALIIGFVIMMILDVALG